MVARAKEFTLYKENRTSLLHQIVSAAGIWLEDMGLELLE